MRSECQVIYALTSAGGRGFLTRPGCRQSQPEHRLAMLAAPPPPPDPAAPAEAGGPGAALPRQSATPGVHLPPRGEHRSPPGPPNTPAHRQRCIRETEGKRREGSFRMRLVSRTQANVLGLKSRSGDGCQLLHGKRKEAAALLDSDRGWQDVAIRKRFKGSHRG